MTKKISHVGLSGLGFIVAAYFGINSFCDWIDDQDDMDR